MNAKRLLLYLGLNALVSAIVTFTVLVVWQQTHPTPACTDAVPAAALVISQTTPLPAHTSAPAATPVPPAPTFYVVQSGDTLGSIAEHYQVSVDELMVANNLTDPNVLNVGQQLVIPVKGAAAAATPTAAALPTNAAEPPRPTVTRDPNAPLPRLAVREIKSAGALENETLVLENRGGPVDLTGWTLRNEAGRQYTFPSLTLYENGVVSVHTAAGQNTVTDLYWGQTEAMWNSGKTALLNDPDGNLHARFTVP